MKVSKSARPRKQNISFLIVQANTNLTTKDDDRVDLQNESRII